MGYQDDGLLVEARSFLQGQKGRIPRIAADTGLKTTFLYSLLYGRTNNPGVRSVEVLLRYKKSIGEALVHTTVIR